MQYAFSLTAWIVWVLCERMDCDGQVWEKGQGTQSVLKLVRILRSPDSPVCALPGNAPKTQHYSLLRQLTAAGRLQLAQFLFMLFAFDPGDFHMH
jgi:hypothetical protein